MNSKSKRGNDDVREIELQDMRSQSTPLELDSPSLSSGVPHTLKIKDEFKSIKLKEQIKIFLICYFSYSLLHVYREFWSMSKKALELEDNTIDSELLSKFDTVYLFTYSLCTFLGGVAGDVINVRILIAVSTQLQVICFLALGMAGYLNIQSPIYFYLVFMGIGFSSSSIFPSIVHTLGNWFSKTHRGVIIGLWATCANIGNILGVQIASIILKVTDKKWEYLMFSIAGAMQIVVFIHFFFF